MRDKESIAKEGEIDLIELIQFVWSKRVSILKIVTLFMILGLLFAITARVEYEASCKLLPESEEMNTPNLGGLSGLAGMAGIDLNSISSSGVMSPEMYPELVKSTPFIFSLLNQPIPFEKLDTTLTSLVYFKDYIKVTPLEYIGEYTIGLPGNIKSLFRDDKETVASNYGFVRFTKQDWDLIEVLSDRIYINVDETTGAIIIRSEMPDPVAAAVIANNLVNELTIKITNYKIEKAQQNLDFTLNRFEEAKSEYNSKQNNLARFTDRNRNITNPIVQIEKERLQNELDVAFEVYKSLATQLEQAKIKVEEKTPIFTVLEPIKIPVEKSKPKRILILVISAIVGGFVSIIIFLTKAILQKIVNKNGVRKKLS